MIRSITIAAGSLAMVLVATVATLIVMNRGQSRGPCGPSHLGQCVNNLHAIDGAKEQWAYKNHKTDGDEAEPHDLDPWLKKGFTSLRCPEGGEYVVNPIGRFPVCTHPAHAQWLLEQNRITKDDANNVLENIGTNAPNSQH